MRDALRCAGGIETNDAALGRQGLDRCDAQLDGLLHGVIHALPARDALRERDGERRFAVHFARLTDPQSDARFADALDSGRVLESASVEDHDCIAFGKAQDMRDVVRLLGRRHAHAVRRDHSGKVQTGQGLGSRLIAF